MLAPPGEKICFLQIEAWCNLYYFTLIKSDIITFHSHNSIIFKEKLTLWSYDYDTFQPKIGQCENVCVLTRVQQEQKESIGVNHNLR